MKSIQLFFTKLSFDKGALLLILTPILTVLLNVQLMIISLLVIIFLDFITGVRKDLYEKEISWNPLKLSFWKSVKSRGMRDTWRKSYEYGIGIIVFSFIEAFFVKATIFTLADQGFTITEVAISLAAIIETYSIFENMEAVSGRNWLKKMISVIPGVKKLFQDKKGENGTTNTQV